MTAIGLTTLWLAPVRASEGRYSRQSDISGAANGAVKRPRTPPRAGGPKLAPPSGGIREVRVPALLASGPRTRSSVARRVPRMMAEAVLRGDTRVSGRGAHPADSATLPATSLCIPVHSRAHGAPASSEKATDQALFTPEIPPAHRHLLPLASLRPHTRAISSQPSVVAWRNCQPGESGMGMAVRAPPGEASLQARSRACQCPEGAARSDVTLWCVLVG